MSQTLTQANAAATQALNESIVGIEPVEPEESWQNLANCLGVDPDLFFPERGAST